jgi:hypothetical protein
MQGAESSKSESEIPKEREFAVAIASCQQAVYIEMVLAR